MGLIGLRVVFIDMYGLLLLPFVVYGVLGDLLLRECGFTFRFAYWVGLLMRRFVCIVVLVV